MKQILYIFLAIVLFALPALAADVHKGLGTINKVDKAAGTVNLTHGPIKSLDWPGMTMDFKVRDKALLDKIGAGMKADFDVAKEPDGTYVITGIMPKQGSEGKLR